MEWKTAENSMLSSTAGMSHMTIKRRAVNSLFWPHFNKSAHYCASPFALPPQLTELQCVIATPFSAIKSPSILHFTLVIVETHLGLRRRGTLLALVALLCCVKHPSLLYSAANWAQRSSSALSKEASLFLEPFQLLIPPLMAKRYHCRSVERTFQ